MLYGEIVFKKWSLYVGRLQFYNSGCYFCFESFKEWEEIWRCETISLVFDYTYYVSYADPPSDLPYHVIASSTAKIPRHPIVLATDDLLIEVSG